MDSIPKRKENDVPRFTEDSLQRIIINPFYAITVAFQLTEEHEPAMGETEWVQANASLMREMGAERWLRQLLDVLEGKVAAPEGPINPSQAVNIDPLFAAEHPPLIEREMCSTSTSCKYATWGQRAGSCSCWMCWAATS
jgi:hypothetical protein